MRNLLQWFEKMTAGERVLVFTSLFSVTAMSVMIFTVGNLTFHSDSAAAVNLALEELRAGTLFPKDWYSSTGLLNLNLPMLLTLQLTSDYLLARDAAQFIYTILLLAAIIAFSRCVTKNHMWLLLVPVVFSCISGMHVDMLFYQAAYTLSPISVFAIISLFCNMNTQRRPHISVSVFYAVAMFISALLMGVAYLQSTAIPLTGAIILTRVVDLRDEPISEFVKDKRWFCELSVIIFLSAIGTWISIAVLNPLVHVYGNTGLAVFASAYENVSKNLSQLFWGLLGYSGFDSGCSMLSLRGMIALLKLGCMVALTFVFPILEFRKWNRLDDGRKFLLVFCAIHVLEVIVILLFGNAGADWTATARYELSSIILLTTVSCDYIYENYIKGKQTVFSSFYVCIVLVFCAGCNLPSLITVKDYPSQKENLYGMSKYLANHDLRYGYAGFWDAGKNTVLSNGTTQISGAIIGQDSISPFLWLTSEHWYDPATWQGETFLLLPDSSVDSFVPYGFEESKFGEPKNVLNYGGYTILVYDYNLSENGFGGKPFAQKRINRNMTFSRNGMMQDDGSIVIEAGDIMFGPYMDVPAGEYYLTVTLDCDNAVSMNITTDSGQRLLETHILQNGENQIELSLSEDVKQLEFVIYGVEGQSIKVDEIRFGEIEQPAAEIVPAA